MTAWLPPIFLFGVKFNIALAEICFSPIVMNCTKIPYVLGGTVLNSYRFLVLVFFIIIIFFFLVKSLSAAVPPFFFLSTILGGASLVFTSLIYLRAAISGETWKPCFGVERAGDSTKNRQSEPPKQPPPRGPRSRSIDNLACEEAYTDQNRV